MTASLENVLLDFGLSPAQTNITTLSICSNAAEPTTISIATSSGLLGYKSWGAGNCFTAVGAKAGNGRQIASVAISDGTITTSGTAGWWAVYSAGTLYAHGTLASTQVVTAGNTFTLTSFTIGIPAQ